MPYLGDFLGLLAREVTLARLHADTEAVRVAELYAADPLLKSFPIPRFRLPAVNLHLSVAVQAMDEVHPGPQVDLSKVKPLFDAILDARLEEAGHALTPDAHSTIDDAVATALEDLTADPSRTVGSWAIAKTLTDAAHSALSQYEPFAGTKFDPQQLNLLPALEAAFIPIRMPPSRLTVAVTAAQLNEAGENVVHLDLTLSEDSMEWTTLNPDDPASAKLVPE